jgi:hypothetical protein
MKSRSKNSGVLLGLQLPTWEFTWECEGSFPHTLCIPGSMWSDSRVSFLACNLPTPCLGREPKARVATPFHPFPLLLKWTRLWSWIPQPLGLGSLQRSFLYSGGLCARPWRTCPLHHIETPYSMHTHKVVVINLGSDDLMLATLCISSDNLMIL